MSSLSEKGWSRKLRYRPRRLSGDILGRAADRQGAHTNRHFGLATEAFQEAQARRIFEGWADTFRAFLDEHYKGE